MEQSIIQSFYDVWVNSEDYQRESALENEIYEKHAGEIKKIIGEKTYCKVGDDVIGLACEAEITGFESGLRYGITFMSGMLKDSAVHG